MAQKVVEKKGPQRTILVFGAHNDDQLIGLGGTIAKYTKEGIRVVVYVFSYGESSHPHYKKKTIARIRVDECLRSDKVLGVTETVFLGLHEGHFQEDFKKKNCAGTIRRAIRKYNPEKIFLHSVDDPHPDHRAVHNLILEILDGIYFTHEVYTYEVWNPLTFRKRSSPRLVVDVTDTFKKKLRSFHCHTSQKMTMMFQIPAIYVRSLLRGLHYGYKHAEVFLKIR